MKTSRVTSCKNSHSVSARSQRLLRLLQVPLGDSTAHAAWNEMQALATLPELDSTTNTPRRVDLLKELWLQRLPPAALHEADVTLMDVLVTKADNLINAAKASHVSDAIFSASNEDLPDTNAAQSSFYKRPPNTQARNRNLGPRSQLTLHGLCYYHSMFGARACKCFPGCQWPKNM